MDEPLDEQYLPWLYSQVASVRLKNPARTYWSLFRQLYAKEFVWTVPNDDNRVADGRDLRYEFVEENELQPDADWLRMGCSMLELLISISRKLSYESEVKPDEWFWEILENLELKDYTDAYIQGCDRPIVNDALDRVIWRTYAPDGRGGMFPLTDPGVDQRKIEIWIQMSMYLLERE